MLASRLLVARRVISAALLLVLSAHLDHPPVHHHHHHEHPPSLCFPGACTQRAREHQLPGAGHVPGPPAARDCGPRRRPQLRLLSHERRDGAAGLCAARLMLPGALALVLHAPGDGHNHRFSAMNDVTALQVSWRLPSCALQPPCALHPRQALPRASHGGAAALPWPTCLCPHPSVCHPFPHRRCPSASTTACLWLRPSSASRCGQEGRRCVINHQLQLAPTTGAWARASQAWGVRLARQGMMPR